MTKEKILTRRWNYIIAIVQGLPTFAFVIYGLSTALRQHQSRDDHTFYLGRTFLNSSRASLIRAVRVAL